MELKSIGLVSAVLLVKSENRPPVGFEGTKLAKMDPVLIVLFWLKMLVELFELLKSELVERKSPNML